jgi:hypothetical protein
VTDAGPFTTTSHSYEAALMFPILVPNVNAITTLLAVTITKPLTHSLVIAPEVVVACASTVNTIPLVNIVSHVRKGTTGRLGRI